MHKRFHFITGLPRAGTTMLGAILRQNPRFYAGMSSPLFIAFASLLENLSLRNEFMAGKSDRARDNALRGLFHNFYEELPVDVVFDTSRAWAQKIGNLASLFPDARFIACVRSLADVFRSFERLEQADPNRLSRTYNFEGSITIHERYRRAMHPGGQIGFAVEALRDAFFGAYSDRLMVVSYEAMLRNPHEVMAAIYQFTGEPMFSHDFGNIGFEADAFDEAWGSPGMHRVHSGLRPSEYSLPLPPDLEQGLVGPYFWETDGALSRADVRFAQ